MKALKGGPMKLRKSDDKPLSGPKFLDVCNLAAENGCIIQIGVHENDRGRYPHRITVKVFRETDKSSVQAFCMDIDPTNDEMNAELGLRLKEWVNKVSSGLILPPGRIIGNA
jgi:predicted amidohydrolase